MTDITPEAMREMAADLEADHRDLMKWLGAKPDAAKSTSSLAAAMLRSIAAEREELRKLLYDIHPDPDHDVVQKYYAYFEANPLPKGAE